MYSRFIKHFVLLMFCGVIALSCQSSPTGGNQKEDEEVVVDDGSDDTNNDGGSDNDNDSDAGADSSSTLTVYEITEDFPPTYPYQTLQYYNRDLNLSDFGIEYDWWEDEKDRDQSAFKRFDLIFYQDSSVVGDTTSAIITEGYDVRVSIPMLDPGMYTFKIIVNELLHVTGEVEVRALPYIANHQQYVETELNEFTTMMDTVFRDLEEALNTEYGMEDEAERKADLRAALSTVQDLQVQVQNQLAGATPEELEALATFMSVYPEVFSERYKSLSDELAAKAQLGERIYPEKLLEENKSWFQNKISFSGILNAFWNSDTDNIVVGEGSLIETVKTWTVYGWAVSLTTGVTERSQKLFGLVTDQLEAELTGETNDDLLKRGPGKVEEDALIFEYDYPVQMQIIGTYQKLTEQAAYAGRFLTDEVMDYIDDLGYWWLGGGNGTEEIETEPLLPTDTTQVTEPISSEYLRLVGIDTEWDLNEIFNIEKDLESGQFTVTAKPQTLDGAPYYGDIEVEAYVEYSRAPEYEDNIITLTASNCPTFTALMPGKWSLIHYETSERKKVGQIDRHIFNEDGTWEEIEWQFASDSTWRDSDHTGNWEGECIDGEAKIYYTHDFWINILYVFTYDGNRDQLIGFSSGLSNGGNNRALVRGW